MSKEKNDVSKNIDIVTLKLRITLTEYFFMFIQTASEHTRASEHGGLGISESGCEP